MFIIFDFPWNNSIKKCEIHYLKVDTSLLEKIPKDATYVDMQRNNGTNHSTASTTGTLDKDDANTANWQGRRTEKYVRSLLS